MTVRFRGQPWQPQALARHLLDTRTRYVRGHLLWTKARNDAGYPYVRLDGRMVGTHRFIYSALVGDLAPREPVHHRCAVRACVRPEHLQRATTASNNLEMLARRGYEARLATAHEWLADAVADMATPVADVLADHLDYLTEREAQLAAALASLAPDHPLLAA